MCIACSIPQATNTHSQYVILIAFPQQQRLQDRASLLRYPYIVCLVQLSACCCGRVSKLCELKFPRPLNYNGKGVARQRPVLVPKYSIGTGDFPREKSGRGVGWTTHLHLRVDSIIEEEQSYNSTPPLGLRGVLQNECTRCVQKVKLG